MAENRTLYWGSGSVPCWKPMIVLAEKGLPYTSKQLSFGEKQHKGAENMKYNPRGQLPTFIDGSTVVLESSAICDYLEYKYPNQGQRLLPEDAALRARVLQRMHETQNLMKKVMEGVVGYQFFNKPEDVDQELLKTKKKEAREELQRWEDYLKKEGDGSYLVGKYFTMADVYFFPILAFCVRSKLNLDLFPAIKDYYQRAAKRPAVQGSFPPHWKDTEGKDLFKDF